MINMKSRAIVVNVFNLFTVLLMFFAYVLIAVPAMIYFHAYMALLLIPIATFLTIPNILIYIVLLISSLKKSPKVPTVTAFVVSLFLLWFGWSFFYPWARYTIHFPSTAGVCWRENALARVKDDLTGFVRDTGGIIPTNDNWKELLIEKGYNFDNTLETWDKSFNSSVVINENIKGMELEKIEQPVVFLFEGPKGLSFGNEETFKQFVKENKYIYVVLTNGASGRIRLKDGKAESLFGGLHNRDLPLVWE